MENVIFKKDITDKINIIDYGSSEDLFYLDFSHKRKKYKYMKWSFYDLGKVNKLFDIESLYLNKNNDLSLVEENDIYRLIEEIENEGV